MIAFGRNAKKYKKSVGYTARHHQCILVTAWPQARRVENVGIVGAATDCWPGLESLLTNSAKEQVSRNESCIRKRRPLCNRYKLKAGCGSTEMGKKSMKAPQRSAERLQPFRYHSGGR